MATGVAYTPAPPLSLSLSLSAVCSENLARLAAKYHRTPAQVFFMFVHSLGIIPLSGTTSTTHMAEDVAVLGAGPALAEAVLAPQEVAEVKQLLHIPL